MIDAVRPVDAGDDYTERGPQKLTAAVRPSVAGRTPGNRPRKALKGAWRR